MKDDVMVSILCEAYNHENYIADALDGFVMQKTNFKYEILIHDDASTDQTAEIIKEYEKQYPHLIKAIYQTENQYSQGVNVAAINEKRAAGKYFALCEGDDYWTDPNKLQMQLDYMEAHPECSLCVHTGLHLENGKATESRPSIGNRNFSVEEIIAGGGDLFDTNTFFCRKDTGNIRPDFYFKTKYSFSDYQLMIYLALAGDVYYMDKVMSVYRYKTPGSWTSRNIKETEDLRKYHQEVRDVLDEVDEYTEGKYHAIIEETKRDHGFFVLTLKKDFKRARSGEYKEVYDSLSLKEKTVFFIKEHLPHVADTYYKIRGS